MVRSLPAYNKGKGMAYAWLLAHVDYGSDKCLIWPFSTCNGYGNLGVNGKHYYAHVLMCEMVNGPAPPTKPIARHVCGNGDLGCVNPRHLSWSTYSRNQLDRAKHGTKNKGWRGKLTQKQAVEIISLKGKLLQREIAKIYGISRGNVSNIQCGRLWTGRPHKYSAFQERGA